MRHVTNCASIIINQPEVDASENSGALMDTTFTSVSGMTENKQDWCAMKWMVEKAAINRSESS